MKRMSKRMIAGLAILLAALLVASMALAGGATLPEESEAPSAQAQGGTDVSPEGEDALSADPGDEDDPDSLVDPDDLDGPDDSEDEGDPDGLADLDEDEPEDEDDAEEEDADTPANPNPYNGLSVAIERIRPSIMRMGDDFFLKATLFGFDEIDFTIQWQYDAGDEMGWIDIEDSERMEYVFINRLALSVVSDRENINYDWRVLVTPIVETLPDEGEALESTDAE